MSLIARHIRSRRTPRLSAEGKGDSLRTPAITACVLAWAPLFLVSPACAAGILAVNVPDPYAKPGEPVSVSIGQSALQNPVTGFQAFLTFDTAVLSITQANVTFTPSPFGMPIFKFVSGADIDVAAGVNFMQGQQPTTANATLVNMTFTAASNEGRTQVTFRQQDPPARFTDSSGNEIVPQLINSPVIIVDGTPPGLARPNAIVVNAAQGATSATVNVQPLRAWDDGSGLAGLSSARSDGQPLSAPYPIGRTIITWIATDRAGNTASAAQDVLVYPHGASAAQARSLPDGAHADVIGPVVTRVFGSYFYVEDVDRAAGLRVNRMSGYAPAESDVPLISGTMSTAYGERILDNAAVSPYGSYIIPGPLTITSEHLQPSWPMKPYGLLARIFGRTEVPVGASDTFALADNCVPGAEVRVELHGVALPPNGVWMAATGTIGADSSGLLLRVNNQGDLAPIVQ